MMYSHYHLGFCNNRLITSPYVSIYQTLWTFAWKSPFGILASMGSWLLAMLVRWFMRWCVPHETVPHETESQSQRFPTCRDKMKFGCYNKNVTTHFWIGGSSLPLEKSKTTSARQRCRSGTITFRDASAYLCPFTNFTTRGGKSFRWMWSRSSPRVGLVVSGCGRCHGTHGGGHTTGAHGLGTHHAGIRSGRIASEKTGGWYNILHTDIHIIYIYRFIYYTWIYIWYVQYFVFRSQKSVTTPV